jgi:transposase
VNDLVISRKVSRAKLVDTVNRLDPKIVAMGEGCGSAHHWDRLFQVLGRTVRLINAYFVKPFVRGSKNDATDAQRSLRLLIGQLCGLSQ